MPTLQDLAQLDRAALLAFSAQLLEEVAGLKAHIVQLQDQNTALKAELDRLSRETKRQAAPFSKGTRKLNPKPPGRKPGAGCFTYRTPPPPDQVTEPPIEVKLPEPICPCCGEPLDEHQVDFAYTTEIPPQPRPIVQPYRVWVYRCRRCRTTVRAEHPDVAPDQFGATAHRVGPRVMAVAHVLHYGLGVPVRKTPPILQVLTGVRLTQSALTQDALRRAAGPIGGEYQTLRASVATAPAAHTDDTGWRVGGDRAHLMVFETDEATVYQVRDRHRNEEVREVIPGDYAGTMITDRGTSYDAAEFAAVKQQKCLAHIQRSIRDVVATKHGKARWFGQRLKALLQESLQAWHDYHEGKRSGYQARVTKLQAAVTRHLRPRQLRDRDNQRLLNELGRHHDRGNLLRFLDDPTIEPTNNRAERALRPAVIARKVSQCSKTEEGAEAFSAFTSVIRTLVKTGADAVERLCQLFRGPKARKAPA